MIEIIPGLPETVLGFSASGTVSASDYERVINPAIDAALTRYKRISVLYRLGPGFSGFDAGAVWQDAKLGLGHFDNWDRIAVVTDVEWIRAAMKAFGFLLHGQLRLFDDREFAAARAWISDGVTE